MNRQEEAIAVLEQLQDTYPDAHIVLHFSNHWELLVSVMLSAQCTDKKVNEVTATLFKKYRTLDDYADADQAEFEQDIYSTGFYKNKAKNIIAAAKMVRDEFSGELPRTMEEMLELPGVARKTANVVLGNAYGVVEGMTVDTHIKRLSQRLGWTAKKTPEQVEKDLMQLLPQDWWFPASYLLIEHGRAICDAKKPLCGECPVRTSCPSADKV